MLARFTASHFPSALWWPNIYVRGIQRVDQLFLALPYALLRTPASYELAHGIQALLFASTALPVWLLGRAAGLSRLTRLLATALVLLAPWAIVSTSFLAEPAAYPAFAWVLYSSWYAATRPSRKVEVLALLALAVAAFSRTQFIALPPLLPLAMLWHELRWELRGEPWRQRARELPRKLWERYPIVTAISCVAIVAILASAAGILPGGGVRSLTGNYGLPHVEALSIVFSRYRYYVSRMAVGTGLVALALALAWILRALVRPPDRDRHALAIICALGLAGLLASLVQGGPDERYVLYGTVPIGLAFAAELDARVRTRRAGLGTVLSVAIATAAVVFL